MRNLEIIKVGTSSVADTGHNKADIRYENIKRLGRDVSTLSVNHDVIVVTSSARRLGGTWEQMSAAWNEAIGDTFDCLVDERHLDGRQSDHLFESLDHGRVAVVNANDNALERHAACYGSNDIVAARLAQLGAEAGYTAVSLAMLTDVAGLLADRNDAQSVIRHVDDIRSVNHLAGDAAGNWSTGGMRTKLTAAGMVTAVGGRAVIAHASESLSNILSGNVGTFFAANAHDEQHCCQLTTGMQS